MTSSTQEGALQQRLSTLTMVAMAFAILNTWIALAGTMAYILPSGGSVSFIYGFIVCVLCNLALAASLGEMAALWPTAGGQYHFMYAICTPRWKRPMSFFIGWTNIAGWLTVVTTQAFFAAQLVSAAAVVASNNAYEATQWKTYLFFLAILTFGTIGNVWGNKILGRWNDMALYWSVLSVVIMSIILLSMSPKTDARQVFTEFRNETGCGFLFILVILFCLTDPATILASNTGMPIVELFLQSTKSRAAATILALMLSVCFINGTSASITSASRLLYAMARDKGIICHNYFAHIEPKLDVPVRTITLCFIFNVLFGLLYLGPAVAFSAYIASCTIFLNVSYAGPVVALLIRGRGILKEYQTRKTPARMGLRTGAVVNVIASVFVIVITIFFCFPTALPVSANTMNYVSAVVGVFYLLLALYWMVYGKTFEGPNFEAIIGQPLQIKGEHEPEAVHEKSSTSTKA
ncbi:Choline transport protein [Fusarium oxysporum f. sp. raphani]|uniref:Choline transport protein n=1 Tax=Fusarium oxysporum f. sp. raphani TaxID=96318 RepID=A0A8J5PLW2_FUSOX|nr:Choline transport protein [Fusarium oxysporum f. sp. raphani]